MWFLCASVSQSVGLSVTFSWKSMRIDLFQQIKTRRSKAYHVTLQAIIHHEFGSFAWVDLFSDRLQNGYVGKSAGKTPRMRRKGIPAVVGTGNDTGAGNDSGAGAMDGLEEKLGETSSPTKNHATQSLEDETNHHAYFNHVVRNT